MAVDPPLEPNELSALLGRGTRFEGKLHFEGRVRIDGAFRGEIRSDDTLVIGEGAEVEGEVDVATVIVKGGVMRANVRARRSIELHVPARVSGSLHAPEIMLGKGVQFEGSCRMAPMDDVGEGGLTPEGTSLPGSEPFDGAPSDGSAG
ncbi:MAG: polymer-forming cytoskeletal protein [Polyangiaceae bacterium]|jgi:cytoskeletal protein CcmA (bactofilin family)|nr:polymer-forming cytoskeletal protein [Polyangiaceae bacterium]